MGLSYIVFIGKEDIAHVKNSFSDSKTLWATVKHAGKACLSVRHYGSLRLAMPLLPKLRVGLFGSNGHQLNLLLDGSHPLAEVTAVCGIQWPGQPSPHIREVPTLDDLLNTDVDLISLCSPRRSEQARHAIQCLEAGKHVLAEKPAALCERYLDEILETAKRHDRCFREMGSIIQEQPFNSMREIVRSGAIGEVVQIFAQKSYPYYPERAQDEELDGGLFLQVGIHAARMIEYVGGQRLTNIQMIETELGNPASGHLRMASAFQGMLENGGCASAIANYFNPRGFGQWGNEALRLFGTLGMIEATDGGTRTRMVVGDKDFGPIDTSAKIESSFTVYAQHLLGRGEMPLSLEDEQHPLRVLLRVKQPKRIPSRPFHTVS